MIKLDFQKYDLKLFFLISAAVIFGVLMVFSSSGVKSYSPMLKQFICAAAGFAAMFATAFVVDYNFYQRHAKKIWFAALILVVLVLIAGYKSHGAKRWISLGFFSFQPSEIAKFAMVVMTADFMARKRQSLDSAKGVAKSLILLFPLAAFIAAEPDLGTPILIAAVWFIMLFYAGANVKPLAAIGGAGAGLVALAIVFKPYRLIRLKVWLSSVFDIKAVLDSGAAEFYNLKQSLYAIGNGGFLGKGLGKSDIKLNYLPEAHTDFIFPVICEELGFLGGCAVLFFFFYIFYKGMKIVKNADGDFAQYLALGITATIVVQALINMSMATGLAPTKGMPLPFISLGGTSLIITMAASGVLINISKKR
ncbi:MAG: FtsW/RodA/SpoVE family cell cycle protein [Endomicrobium sp.]|jgi:cell division protein FtsW|nr:FtsW/RodA/SpoVE family cell cycle protein [Endomicrobium sp.]